MTRDSEFPLIRRELIEKIDKIDKFICGDPLGTPPVVGVDERLKKLESVEKERVKTKDSAIELAIGSVTIAIGGAIIWVGAAVREAFMKH